MKTSSYILVVLSLLLFCTPKYSLGQEQDENKEVYIKYTLPNSFIHKDNIDLPKILDSYDMDLYYKIFKLQYNKDFRAADKLILKLHNKILLGYVYYERYESKYYKSSVAELRKWMINYYDLPVAKQVYALLKLKLGNRIKPNTPRPLFVGSIAPLYIKKDLLSDQDATEASNFTYISPIKPTVSNLTRKLDRYLKRGETRLVSNSLEDPKNKRLLNKKTYAYYANKLVESYFVNGHDNLVNKWGNIALSYNEKYFPSLHIYAGLSNWRSKNYEEALKYFNFIVNNKNLYSSDIISKAAYWSSRCYFKLKKFQEYYSSLKVASNYIYDFYGILASEELGIEPNYNNVLDVAAASNVSMLINNKYAKRALALVQFGMINWSEQELLLFAKYSLKSYSNKAQTELLKALTYLAKEVPMPMLSVRLAGAYGMYYGFGYLAYPIYIGDGSQYIVDPLLVTSIIRRESLFNSSAISSAGAVGLMQLMPNTAKMVIKNGKYNKINVSYYNIKNVLRNPKYNFDIGQIYIKMLINNSTSNGSLVYALASWNGGILNLRKWMKQKFRIPNDKLFFIESIPFQESRDFVKKVLTDYWIYQITVGATPQTALSLITNVTDVYVEPSSSYINKVINFNYDIDINYTDSMKINVDYGTTTKDSKEELVLSNAETH